MTRVVYHIVPHDGGFAYRVGDVFSEPYPTRDLAEAAAKDAARRQEQARGTEDTIEYQDDRGRWRTERAGPADLPETGVDPDDDST